MLLHLLNVHRKRRIRRAFIVISFGGTVHVWRERNGKRMQLLACLSPFPIRCARHVIFNSKLCPAPDQLSTPVATRCLLGTDLNVLQATRFRFTGCRKVRAFNTCSPRKTYQRSPLPHSTPHREGHFVRSEAPSTSRDAPVCQAQLHLFKLKRPPT